MKPMHRDASTHRELLQRLRSDIVDLREVVDPEYRGPVQHSPMERPRRNDLVSPRDTTQYRGIGAIWVALAKRI